MFKKSTVLIIAVLFLLLGMCSQSIAGNVVNIRFVDVGQDHWAGEAVENMVEQGIIQGYPDKTFKPEKSVTREEFAALICKTFNLELKSPTVPSFYDVQPDSWSYAYVEAAKDYLTGYRPPNSRPAFYSPGQKATREDVAVALVKAKGLKSEDLINLDILEERFIDIDTISYSLREYVALAVENRLFNGDPEGTFRGDEPVTRAEVATLLYKIIKTTATDTETLLTVSAPSTSLDGTIYISGTTNKDAKVTINNKPAEVIDGQFKEGFKLEQEGMSEFVIIAKRPGGQETIVRKQVTYTVNGPEIVIDEVPEKTTVKIFKISGRVTDKVDNEPKVYLNGEKLYTWSGGHFEESITLTEGENVLTFKATNNSGKSAVVTKTITFGTDAPALLIDYIPDTTNLKTVQVSGKVTDKNDSQPNVYLNDTKLYLWGEGYFEKSVVLKEGPNNLIFKAINSFGKITTDVKTITFNVEGPALIIDYIPTATTGNTVTVSGKVTDQNDNSPNIYLNDEKLNTWGEGYFEKTVTLTEGENTLTFMAANTFGKTTTSIRKITVKL
jgi:hypothetical protein